MALSEALMLNEAFQRVLDRLEQGREPLFITGQAGTGKSTLLRLFQQTTRKKVVVTAPTGVAALQAGGQTIHSFFSFPPHLFGPGEVRKGRYAQLFQKMDVLIIDEISMVRADILDRIDRSLQIHRSNTKPFGGVQMVFIGDLFQLPPVVRQEEAQILYGWGYDSPYFFSAKCLAPPFELETIELKEVFRQKDSRFLKLLEEIRTNTADFDTLDALNQRVGPMQALEDFQLVLAARNAKVDQINRHKLDQLQGIELLYMAEIKGTFSNSAHPTEQVLRLREGAQVMFIRNDADGAYVNGTLGKIRTLREKKVEVAIPDGKGGETLIHVEPAEWEMIRYALPEKSGAPLKREVTGVFRQLPIRLAWAVTIHKSQGQTFDRVVIDLSGGLFEHGQLYVALSRCRTLEGITLSQAIRPQDIRVDERVADFYQMRC
jgi:ATP-dependent DNA helicase PIF1